jgi:hypothetical protein
MDGGTLKTPIPFNVVLTVNLVWGGEAILYSESGQKQSVKLLQSMVYSTIQHPPPPLPHSHTLSVYTVHLVWEGERGGKSERR